MSAPRIRHLRQILAPDERLRESRFISPKDQEHFAVSRGFLRTVLSCYLRMDPSRLQFRYGSNGKPFLAEECGGDELCFNLSHSGGLALCAVTRSRSIGVDLERIQPSIADENIAENFFSPNEVAALRGLPLRAQPRAFTACWTRKEAYVKAKGETLATPLDQFEVSLLPREPAALLRVAGDDRETRRWSLHELHPGPGYVGALAVEGNGLRLKFWQWSNETVISGQ